MFVAPCSSCVVCCFGVSLACVGCRFNVCRSLFVVCCVLSGCCACRTCAVFVVRPLLSDVTWLMFVVHCLLLVVCLLLLLLDVRCLLSVMRSFSFAVCRSLLVVCGVLLLCVALLFGD